ncbi:MAG: thiamine-monophosphate kinase [Verrucomicrobia bacterium]|nr:thiamine-monophosphate kinase [Verrucomicrobiota bacterium]
MKKSTPSEDRWIECWTAPFRRQKTSAIRYSFGHDCAVLRSPSKRNDLVLKTDAVVEGVHFTPATPPAWIGRKALARPLSDLAAAGAVPKAALITVGCPNPAQARRLRKVYLGLSALAKKFHLHVVGGETVRTRQLFLSVSLLGEVAPGNSPGRSGGKPGDHLFVTGKLGGSWPHRHLTFDPRLAEGQWLIRHRLVSAMLDLSDGLGSDLPRLARASGVGFQVDPKKLPLAPKTTPRVAFSQGEDYELLFSVPPRQVALLRKTWPFPTPITEIGRLLPKARGFETGGLSLRGYDHFR